MKEEQTIRVSQKAEQEAVPRTPGHFLVEIPWAHLAHLPGSQESRGAREAPGLGEEEWASRVAFGGHGDSPGASS